MNGPLAMRFSLNSTRTLKHTHTQKKSFVPSLIWNGDGFFLLILFFVIHIIRFQEHGLYWRVPFGTMCTSVHWRRNVTILYIEGQPNLLQMYTQLKRAFLFFSGTKAYIISVWCEFFICSQTFFRRRHLSLCIIRFSVCVFSFPHLHGNVFVSWL